MIRGLRHLAHLRGGICFFETISQHLTDPYMIQPSPFVSSFPVYCSICPPTIELLRFRHKYPWSIDKAKFIQITHKDPAFYISMTDYFTQGFAGPHIMLEWSDVQVSGKDYFILFSITIVQKPVMHKIQI